MIFTEPTSVLIETLGDTLTFSSYTLKGFLQFSITLLASDDSSYIKERREFAVNVLTSDAKAKGLSSGTTFTVSDGSYVYTFKISGIPVADVTGFTKLTVTYEGKV